MSIEATRSGRQRVRIGSGRNRKSFGTRPTLDEARLHERATAVALADAGGDSLAKWGTKWLDRRELDGVRGVKTERGRWRTHVERSSLGATSIELVSRATCEAWIRELQTKETATPHGPRRPLSPKTIREAVGLVRQALDAAGVRPNPLVELRELIRRVTKRKGVAATVEPWTHLDGAEQHRLITCATIPEPERLIVAFAMLTGLRQGEQMNLELTDIHTKAPAHVVVRFGSKGQPPKNGKIRRVYLSDQATRVTKRWLEVLSTWAPSNAEGLAFPTKGGSRCQPGKTPLHGSTWNTDTKKVQKVFAFPGFVRLAGIKRAVRWHDLRHTCGSSLIAGFWGRRWTRDEVRMHLGHTSVASTDRYVHLGESVITKAIAETRWPTKRAPENARGAQLGGSGRRGKPSKTVVGRQGLEPWTYGLKDPSDPEDLAELAAETGSQGGHIQALAGSIGQLGGQFAARARAALAALDAGDPFARPMLARLLEEVADAHPPAKKRRRA